MIHLISLVNLVVGQVINGGSGTDVLNINYSINLEALVISYDNSSIYSFVDSAGGTMNFQSIETLNVNSVLD